MSRYARTQRVYFFEEPVFDDVAEPQLRVEQQGDVNVVFPRLPRHYTAEQALLAQRAVLDQLIVSQRISQFILWYYTPLALKFSQHLKPLATVYDCMDELSAFKNASSELPVLERTLMRRADVVFTGGHSLYDAKKDQHRNIHAMPSSVDVPHFATARRQEIEPADQGALPHPRLGFFGVLDERLDIALLAAVAKARPDWQMIMVGPVVKIDPSDLPSHPNIHYLGPKAYAELPSYIAGWDVALLLFARNDATRFISPTKTPEYLAAGKPVVSTSIRDVVTPYGDRDLVRIADAPADFIRACELALSEPPEPRRVRADVFLRGLSWDRTWAKTASLINAVLESTEQQQPAAAPSTGLSLGA